MNEVKNKLKVIRLVLLGDTFFGKNSIFQVFVGKEFYQYNIAITGYGQYETQIELKNGEKIKLILLDTAGQERFRSTILDAIKNVHGLVYVFDVTRKKTFDNIYKDWMESA